ncbi:MAG TPA: hypothetical protein VKE93_19205 [Candidatus Angelobacter sp.]|nr:hypothetical protein [Candidatus Angelobacter sp.]
MKEGWHGKEYLILFAESEVANASERYAISECIPGCQVLGFRGWDDFIVRDSLGNVHSVPTVPLDTKYLSPLSLPSELDLAPDPRFGGKIKWYVKPLVFGGDANHADNLIWVSHDEHAQLVRWWNDLYRSVKPRA